MGSSTGHRVENLARPLAAAIWVLEYPGTVVFGRPGSPGAVAVAAAWTPVNSILHRVSGVEFLLVHAALPC